MPFWVFDTLLIEQFIFFYALCFPINWIVWLTAILFELFCTFVYSLGWFNRPPFYFCCREPSSWFRISYVMSYWIQLTHQHQYCAEVCGDLQQKFRSLLRLVLDINFNNVVGNDVEKFFSLLLVFPMWFIILIDCTERPHVLHLATLDEIDDIYIFGWFQLVGIEINGIDW